MDEAIRMINEGECGTFSPVMLDCFRLAKYELLKATEENFSFADGEMDEEIDTNVKGKHTAV